MQRKLPIIDLVRRAASRKMLFLPHAVRQMSRADRMISPPEMRRVVERGEVIEDYPEDPRGHSCLMLGRGRDGQPIHVVCSPKGDYLAIITAYIPTPEAWRDDFRSRRSP
jgi:hypothetical protein